MPELFHYHENLTEIMKQGPSGNLKFSAEMQINQNEFLLLDIFSAGLGGSSIEKNLIYTATILQKIF